MRAALALAIAVAVGAETRKLVVCDRDGTHCAEVTTGPGGPALLVDAEAIRVPVSQPSRWVLPDGGASGLYSSGGQACADLAGVPARTLVLTAEVPLNLCIRPSSALPSWDGGCSSSSRDLNFGRPVQAWETELVLLDAAATHVCAVSDAGAVSVALFSLGRR